MLDVVPGLAWLGAGELSENRQLTFFGHRVVDGPLGNTGGIGHLALASVIHQAIINRTDAGLQGAEGVARMP